MTERLEADVVNDPAVVAELTAVCEAYERAFIANDVATLEGMFWGHTGTVRFGLAESLWGHAEIVAFRRGTSTAGHARERRRVVINTFGDAFGTCSSEDARAGGRVGRITQAWVMRPEGWRIVAAHVSMVDPR